jgi:hypothetical protein
LEFKGLPKVAAARVAQKPKGLVLLPAREARLHGDTIQYESGDENDNIGYWLNAADWADWDAMIAKPGRYTVTAEIAALEPGTFGLSVAGQNLSGAAPVTSDYHTFKSVTLGVVDIPAKGKRTLAIHPVAEGWHPMNVRSIRLEPAKNP